MERKQAGKMRQGEQQKKEISDATAVTVVQLSAEKAQASLSALIIRSSPNSLYEREREREKPQHISKERKGKEERKKKRKSELATRVGFTLH